MSDMPPPPPPPAYAYPETYAAPGQRFRPIGKVSKALVILEIIVAVTTALSVIALISVRDWGDRYLSGSIDEDEFVTKVAAFAGASLLVAGVSIAAIVLLCIWSYRMAANLPLLGRSPRRWGPGWGIAGWILTAIFALAAIVPYLMHSELWKGSDPSVPRNSPSWKSAAVDPLLHVWIVLTLAGAVTQMASGFQTSLDVGRSSETLAKELSDRLAVNVIAALLSLAAAVVFIVLIRRLSARHMIATGER